MLDRALPPIPDRAPARGRRVAILTFGCRVNQYETEAMRALLGPTHELVEADEDADVYILNGCSVTALAEKKARQAVRRIRSEHPEAVVLVTGCLGESAAQGKTSFHLGDLVAGNGWKARVGEVVAHVVAGRRGLLPLVPPSPLEHESSHGSSDRVRAHLKAQDGCSGACAYCRAVQLRGASRSKRLGACVAEARAMVAGGIPEIVLTGVNLAEYRCGGDDLAELARRMLEIPGLLRLRLASINIAGLSAGLLDVAASDPRFCPHLHVPLQSGDDAVLRAMRRPYTAATYRQAIERVRTRLPHATLGADVIVGFPGETDDAFRATCRVVEEIGFANLHVFRFSPRRGTEAAALPGAVPESVKRERARELASIGTTLKRRVLDARVGKTEDVLVETARGDSSHGHTAGYLEATFSSRRPIPVGSVCRVRIVGATEGGLEGIHDDAHGSD